MIEWVESEIIIVGDNPEQEQTEAAPTEIALAQDERKLEELVRKAVIYVVDDDPFMRRLMFSGLKMFGFENIEVFDDGEDALNALAKLYDEKGRLKKGMRGPDMILSDTEMRKVGGLELYRKMKEMIRAELPLFIAFSGDHSKKEEWGSVPFVQKPYDFSQLQERIIGDLKARFGSLKN